MPYPSTGREANAAAAAGDSAAGAVPVDLPAIEREILARWQTGRVFARSLEQTAGGEPWICYERPGAANGMPGLQHVQARVFRDAFSRFKTMQGYHVPRRAGWDCHGLLIEVAVESELGLTGRADIEAYGVEPFAARCRESVLRHAAALTQLTERIGYWTDPAAAYWTMDSGYIESVWWSLKAIFGAGLLSRERRVSPYCPRCETVLSDQEMVAPGAVRTVTDPSMIVRFQVTGLPPGASPELAGADLLTWTTAPWTLVANAAIAVDPAGVYAIVRRSGRGDRVVLADDVVARVLGEGWHVVGRVRGAELAGASYELPFRFGAARRAEGDAAGGPAIADARGDPDARADQGVLSQPGGGGAGDGPTGRVVTGSFVSARDGTGLVALAPAFGADDLAASREHGLPVAVPVRPDGRFDQDLPLVGGLFFRDASAPLVRDLADRGRLLRSQDREHGHPHCWRCGTPVLHYAATSWFLRTTAIREQLLTQRRQATWLPAGARPDRPGEWLVADGDWALSRTRYWGTPLPVWTCPAGHLTCVGSLAELSALADRHLTGLDLHRPLVDDVVIGCPECGEPARRVPEVIDAGYDAGAMPFAQFGAPWQNAAPFAAAYPAQFACEAVDQARGWFAALATIATLAVGRPAYETVLYAGPVADERGEPMSPHRGNVLAPLPLLESFGADAVRWLFVAAGAAGTPGDGAREARLREITRRILLPYWESTAFLIRLAASRGPDDGPVQGPPVPDRPAVDRWALSELHALIRDVTGALHAFDTGTAADRITSFLDGLRWYVRRLGLRCAPDPAGPAPAAAALTAPDTAAAVATLGTCLDTLTRLMAPITPFLTDYVWGALQAGTATGTADSTADSVHLASWPVADLGLIDEPLAAQVALARRLAELGRVARAGAGLGEGQPLTRGLAGAAGFAELTAELRAQVADELGVRVLEPLDSGTEGALVTVAVQPSAGRLSKRFGADAPAVAAAIRAADPAELAERLRSAGVTELLVGGKPVTVTREEAQVTQAVRPGWAAAVGRGGETVALEVVMPPELRRQGLARTAAQVIREARADDGLAEADGIRVTWQTADPELAMALIEHRTLVAAYALGPGRGFDRADDRVAVAEPGGPDGLAEGTAGSDPGRPGQDTGPAESGTPAEGARAAAEPEPSGRRHADAGLGLTFWLGRA